MLRSIKIYIGLCLIGLQFIAPFIHAHAFGLDAMNERAVHIHANAPSAPSAATTNLAGVGSLMQSQASYVVTIASGIEPQIDEGLSLSSLVATAIFFCLALILASVVAVFFVRSSSPLVLRRLFLSRHNPRAPPRF